MGVARSGLPHFLHRKFFRDSLTILMYHGVVSTPLAVADWCFLSEASFRRQANYLKENFRVVSLCDALVMMQENLKELTAVITFDDGFLNNYRVAFPILMQLELPATIFLSTGLVNTDDTVWYCKINRAISATKKTFFDWRGKRYSLVSKLDRFNLSEQLQEYIKNLSQRQLVGELRKMITDLGDDINRPIEPDSPFRILDGGSIKEMMKSGLIEFGAHTHSHAILSSLTSEERRQEIIQSLVTVENLTGSTCRLFSYPNGRQEDYDNESIEILGSYGVKAAVTAIGGPNHQKTPPLQLRRYGVGADADFDEFRCKTHLFTPKTMKSFFL